MSNLINGLHHVALKCATSDEFRKVKEFYGSVLGLKKLREWKSGVMFDTGCGIVEIFNNADTQLPTGTIRHFAFVTDDIDACVATVKAAGYEVFDGPRDVDIPSDPIYRVRVAFCYGPLGEEIEFSCER